LRPRFRAEEDAKLNTQCDIESAYKGSAGLFLSLFYFFSLSSPLNISGRTRGEQRQKTGPSLWKDAPSNGCSPPPPFFFFLLWSFAPRSTLSRCAEGLEFTFSLTFFPPFLFSKPVLSKIGITEKMQKNRVRRRLQSVLPSRFPPLHNCGMFWGLACISIQVALAAITGGKYDP